MANRRNLIGKVAVLMDDTEEVVPGSYIVNLNSNWQNSSINPDSSVFNSYESYSNKGTGNSGAIMYIDIKNYSSFRLYIRSYAESSYDYVMVSQLDQTIAYNTSYSDTSLIKAHTRGNQQSGTALSNYTLVEFTDIDGGEHRISIIYRKDGSVDNNDDKGYVLVAKDASNAGGSGGSNSGSGESSIDVNNYLTIVALEDGLTVKLSDNACEYCVDGDGNWKTLAASTDTAAINTGQTLSFRGNLTPVTDKGIGKFTISKSCNLEGNCMSMLFGDNAVNNLSLGGKDYAFYRLFENCSKIKSVSANFLPATTLASYCYYYMFYCCTGLTTTPSLPATTLADYCYSQMFSYCRGLTTAPELPATTLADHCYHSMFISCDHLAQAPTLPATTLATRCYCGMFDGCSSLTTAPTLPVTTLADHCYAAMFSLCSSLTQAPELPATTLTNGCYASMFQMCSSLTTAPTLPATTLAESCYESMFSYCYNLTQAPELPVTTLADHCYESMFESCTSLRTAPTLPATTLTNYCYYQMFKDCTSLRTAPTLPATTLTNYCYYQMFSGTNVLPDCSNINFSSSSVVSSGGLKGLFSGTKVTYSNLVNILPINSNGKCCLPVMTLTDDCYSYMFYKCRSLTQAPVLPATTLAKSCYYYMFSDSGLTTTPSLPATTLVDYCYSYMFFGCSNLTTITSLPATTLAIYCYERMFRDCTNLRTAPTLPATTLVDYCYSYMFFGCSSLTKSPTLPATTLAKSCYSYMFYNCTSLTTAPTLPATVLKATCYNNMFKGCSKLNYIKMLATDISASNCLNSWVTGVASTGTFVRHVNMTSLLTGTNGIPSGWTVQTA